MDLNDIIDFASEHESAGQDRINAIRSRLDEYGADPAQVEAAAVEAFNATYADGQYESDDEPVMELLADVTDAARIMANHGKNKRDASRLKERIDNRNKDEGNEEAPEAADSADQGADPQAQGAEGEEGRGEAREGRGGESGRGGARRDGGDAGGESAASRVNESSQQNSGRRKVALSSQELNAHRSQMVSPHGRARRSFSLTAGADVPDVPAGQTLDMQGLAQAAVQRMQSMPLGQDTSGEMRRSIGTINRVYDDDLVVDGMNPMTDAAKIDALADEKNLPGGSLVAAAQQEYDNLVAEGGMQAFMTPPGDIWCSPSETDYSLCPALATRTGMLDLPSFQVKRGGIRYPVWKQYPDQHRPLEHGPGDKEESNDQAQGWYPSHNPAQDYPYDAQHTSDGPRHDWHGYAHLDRNTIGGRPDLEDPDYFVKNPKKHIFGPCVEWAEERMHMAYLWLEEDILRNHTYPELAERFMSDAMLSHAHFMNELYIRWIVSHSDRLDPFWAGAPGWGGPGDPPRNGIIPPGPMSYPIPVATNNYYPGSTLDQSSFGLYGMGSAAEAVMERIGWLVTWFRNTYRMAWNTSLEAIAPWWFREYLKVDVERKLNRPHNPKVSNAEVDAYFRTWGVKVNWVYDWQDMPSTEYHPPFDDVISSHIMPRGGWPNACDIVLYPAGSWTLAEQNIIRLDATYDSNRLRNNRFTSLFMEDGWMLLNRCNRSFVVQLKGLCQNGATGAPDQPCQPDTLPSRREQIKAGDGGAKEPPQELAAQTHGQAEQPAPPSNTGQGNKSTGGKKNQGNGNGQ